MRDCGCVSVNAKNSILPKIQLHDSVKKWQNSYFYIRNLTEADRIGLPGFTNAPPATKAWIRKVPSDEALEGILLGRLQRLLDTGLTPRDLTLAWMSRWLLPLRARAHKMCFFSGARDPTRTSMEALPLVQMRDWVSIVITDRIGRNCKFGRRPYSREDRGPRSVSFLWHCLYFPQAFLAG